MDGSVTLFLFHRFAQASPGFRIILGYSSDLLKDKSLRHDRQISLEYFAHRAARAAACSDYQTTFKIVKSLAGVSPAPLQSVFARDGTLLTEADNIRDRWRQHHAEVLSAIIVPSPCFSVSVSCSVERWPAGQPTQER